MRASLKGWGRRLAKPQRQSGALTADVLAVIRLTAVQPRKRGRGIETAEQAAERGKFDVALVAALSDAGLRRSEASSLTWGDVQRWDDGSGRITVVRSKTDVEAAGAVVAITPAAMEALFAIRPTGAGGEVKVFGLSESQIARRVKMIAKAAGLADWEFFSGHSGRVGMARRMAQNGGPHPRDRAPGTLETGRRHGRPLHPRGDRRVGAAVSLVVRNHRRTAIPKPVASEFSARVRGEPDLPSSGCTIREVFLRARGNRRRSRRPSWGRRSILARAGEDL